VGTYQHFVCHGMVFCKAGSSGSKLRSGTRVAGMKRTVACSRAGDGYMPSAARGGAEEGGGSWRPAASRFSRCRGRTERISSTTWVKTSGSCRAEGRPFTCERTSVTPSWRDREREAAVLVSFQSARWRVDGELGDGAYRSGLGQQPGRGRRRAGEEQREARHPPSWRRGGLRHQKPSTTAGAEADRKGPDDAVLRPICTAK
jgi:hypothetical protein